MAPPVNGVGEVAADLWERATATHAPLDLPLVLGLAVAALLLAWSPWGYRLVRHLVTLVHEAGHALVAVLAGRRLSGIRLHSDTSGVTLSRGRPRGPGMVLTLAAGYPAPALAGLAGAWLVGAGYAAGSLWLLVLTCVLMLLLIRNLYGLWVVLVTGAAVGVLSWAASPVAVQSAAYLVVLSLLLAAPRSVVEMQRARRRPGRLGGGRSGCAPVSDADQLAGLTGLPAGLWTGVFWLLCLACLGVGGWILWP
ncbi:M50 family metallopeptidase [Citricoccus nitrophenolicus]|uniref:M50 family metallopeptidase n=1 Tax=Citricoccus nitrophenolicus TaxID=863575 RepID=UPI0039B63B35